MKSRLICEEDHQSGTVKICAGWVSASMTVYALSLMLSVLWFACFSRFDCHTLIPTPGYVAVYPSLERLTTLGLTVFGVQMALTCFGIFAHSVHTASQRMRTLQLRSGLLLCVLLPLLPVLSDVNTPSVFQFEAMRLVCAWACGVLFLVWLPSALCCLDATDTKLFLSATIKLILATLILLLGLMIGQWYNSYKGVSVSWLNEIGFGASHWVALVLMVSLPCLMCLSLPRLAIILRVSEKTLCEVETELSKFSDS